MDVYERVLNMQRECANITDSEIPILYQACKEGDFEAVKYIIDSGLCSPNEKAIIRENIYIDLETTEECDTCVNLASWNGFFDIVKLLVEAGADINSTILWNALRHRRSDIVYYLIDKGVDVNPVDGIYTLRCSPLDLSIKDGDVEITKCLVKAGAIIGNLRQLNFSLSHTAKLGNYEMVKYVIENMSGINQDWFISDFSPLFSLSPSNEINNERIINYILDRVKNLNEPDDSGWYPIHYIALRESVDVMEELLKREIRLDVLTPDGFDVYDIVLLTGNEMMMKIFLL
jgi:ankyrin repeat protein